MAITLRKGDRLQFNVTFYHRGAADSGVRIRAAIGKQRVVGGVRYFDELGGWCFVEVPFGSTIPESYTDQQYSKVVTINVGDIGGAGNPEPGNYEVYVKVFTSTQELFWYGAVNDIILQGLESSTLSNLTVTYQKA